MQHTPPSLEIARKGLRARVEDITLADFQMNEQVSRDSFGINEFFDTNAYKDTLSLDLNFDNPANFSTPVLSPQASRLVENTTAKKKKNFFNQTTVYKLGKKEIMRKYEDMCIKQSENQSFFLFKEFRVEYPNELKEIFEFFSENSKVLQSINEKNEFFPENSEIPVENFYFEAPENLSANFEVSNKIDFSCSPAKIVTPAKSVQTVEFEEYLKKILDSENSCFFSTLVENNNRTAAAKAFSSLMILAYSTNVKLDQKKKFGEIRIIRY